MVYEHFKLTVNGATIVIDQTTDGNITIGVNTQGSTQPVVEDRRTDFITKGVGYHKAPEQTNTPPVGSVGTTFSPEQLGKLREVIRSVAYGIMDLSPSDVASTVDGLRRDRKLQEKYHLEKEALSCLHRLVGDTFYDKALKDFKI